jgi:hypothetical protein
MTRFGFACIYGKISFTEEDENCWTGKGLIREEKK